MEVREALVALNMIDHVGPVRVRQLLEHFGDAPAVLQASQGELMRVRGIGEETATAIAGWERTVNLAAELKRAEEYGCRLVIPNDAEYPELLRQIYDPPIVLYVRGNLTTKDKNGVAIVGSRMTTPYGQQTARRLSYQLAYVGVTVVSGGARGIDTAAHQGALSAKGRTIAVLGNGIKIVYTVLQLTPRSQPLRNWGGFPFAPPVWILPSAPSAALLTAPVGAAYLYTWKGCRKMIDVHR